jgi:surface protein
MKKFIESILNALNVQALCTSVFMLFLGFSSYTQTFTQLGNDIDGEAEGDQAYIHDLSGDGTRLAVGSRINSAGGVAAGHVRIFEYNGTAWQQLGDDIDGAEGEGTGLSQKLSTNGSRVAISARLNDDAGVDAGQVRIYEWNGSSWGLLGNVINGSAAGDLAGEQISFSGDGNRVAIGAPANDVTGNNRGEVRIFEWNGASWNQIGSNIYGEGNGDFSGNPLDISRDGNRVIVAGRFNDGSAPNGGHTRVYEWNGSDWDQVGLDIDGDVGYAYFGQSLAINGDGGRIAMGSTVDAGFARVYEWDGSAWQQMGSTINGEVIDENSGTVRLNDDGNILAIGVRNSDDGGVDAGQVRIYKWNGADWIQSISDINGEAAGDQSGSPLSLSADGSRIAIGALGNDGNGLESGHVRVFELTGIPTLTSSSPTANANNVARDANIVFSFDQNIDQSTIDNGTAGDPTDDNITIHGSQTGLISGIYTGDGASTITFNPTNDFQPGEIVFVTVTDGVKSTSNGPATNHSFQFTALTAPGPGISTVVQNLISSSIDTPSDLTAVDMDQDGDLDLLMTAVLDDKISWFENDGAAHPAFTERVVTSINDGPWRVVAGDIDGDGDVDIVSASRDGNTVAWYENDGAADPSFSEHSIAGASRPRGISIGDVDGDGDLDIFSATEINDRINWYENDGATNPSFSINTVSSNADGAYSVTVGDLDGDGDLDLISASQADSRLVWYENDGYQEPSFTEIELSDKDDFTDTYSVLTGDMDGDGDLDLIAASRTLNVLSWFENDGAADPTFSEQTITISSTDLLRITIADMNGDGDLDIVATFAGGQKTALYDNDGGVNPIFTEEVYTLIAGPYTSIAVGDLDGDGDLDLVLGDQNNNTVAWYENLSPFITTWETTTASESVTIPTTGIGYNYTVDWGDGTVESGFTGDASHEYASAGIHTVSIIGDFPRIYFNSGNEGQMVDKILTVEQWGDIEWSSMLDAFAGCSNLTSDATDAPDLTNVSTLQSMFLEATSFNGAIGNWDVSNVSQFAYMFFDANSFNQDLSTWVTTSATSFDRTFRGATAFNQDISSWDVSNVTAMDEMFYLAGAFNQDISNWQVSSVSTMGGMFNFSGFNQDIGGWDVSNVTQMQCMFCNNSAFDQDLGSWDISNLTDISGMFDNSGMSFINYDKTLQGWSTLDAGETQIPTLLTLGATGVEYCDNAGRNTLINSPYSWTINGDVQNCPDLLAQFLLDGNGDDTSEYGNDAIVNGATLTTDRFGNGNSAYLFDGDDGISVSATSINSPNLSLSAWFYFPESADGTHQIVEINGAAALAYADGVFKTVLNINGDFQVPETAIAHSEWHLGTVTYDGSFMRSYLDGELFEEREITGQVEYLNASSPINIGFANTSENFFVGGIDNVSIYNRALSASEIESLYSEGGWINPRTTLATIYSSLGGDNWVNNTNWNSEVSMAEWHGLTVRKGLVTGLNLSSNNLDGALPSSIENLSNIDTLIFFNNPGLGGNIPSEIGSLSKLTRFSLQGCSFTGSIPNEIGNLVNLKNLVLGPNQLTGDVPASFANLVNIGVFAIHNNELTNLPDLTGMPATLFYVYGNRFTFDELLLNETFVSTANTAFSPQTVDNEETLTVVDTEEVTLTTSISTPNTNYQWYFNDEIIEGANLQDHVFTFNSSLEGEYYVVMTNDDLPNVTITRAPYIVRDEINTTPTFLSFADGSVEGVLREGLPIGTLAGVLTTEDVDPVDTYTYTFVSGSGDGFNNSFTISNDSVFTAVELDPVTAPVLRFRVRSTDAGGEFVENALAIQVAPIQVCNNDVFTASSGTFDDGSGNFDYEINFACSWLIELSPENQVRLSFSEFNTEQDYDFVRVYDGSDDTATLLAELSGESIPEVIISSSNTLFITFDSDLLEQRAGWTANYSTVTPVAYYPFNGDAVDASPYGNDGTVSGATLVGDRFGNANSAYSFDGATSSIQAPSAITGTNVPFSIATWVRWNGGSLQEIVSWWNETSISKVYLGPQESGELRFGDSFTSTGAFIPENEWVHIAATYDGSVAYIYINGVLSANSSSGLEYDFASGDLFIGKQGTNNLEYFDGLIDDVRIYDITLSANEIANLYSVSNTDVLAVYNFDGNLVDNTGNGFDGVEISSGNSFTSDRLGVPTSAYDFDIANAGAIETSSFANYDFGDEITVMGWIRPDTYPAADIQLFNNSFLSGSGFEFRLVNTNLDETSALTKRKLFAGITGISFGNTGDAGLVNLDEWTHVAFRFSRGQGTSLYINGENVVTYGFVAGTNDLPIPISTDGIIMGEGFDGEMDEIKIFNTALTNQEILDQYNENLWPFASLAFRGPENSGENTIDQNLSLSPVDEGAYLGALQLYFDGDYQFRATASDGFEAFMGDNELDGIAEPGSAQLALTSGFYAIGFRQSNFGYFVEPINSVGIIGNALTGDETGWNSDIDLTDLGNGIYQIRNLTIYDGLFKLRINDAWEYIDWGSNNVDGTLDYRGSDIPISAGTYTFTFDLVNNKYTIIDVSNSVAVAELDFSGNLTDDSGFGNDGTSASTTFTIGRFGSDNTAIVLNGTNNVNLGNDASINLSNGFTMNIWINPTDNDNAGGIFTSGGSFHQHIAPTFFNWRYFQNEEENFIDGIPIEAPLDAWTMITWTYDGGVMRFYDDGVLVYEETVFGDLDVNANSYSIGNGFNGAVDAFQWIDGILSDKEIQYLYNENVILDYALDGNTNDQSGNDINGTLPNGGTFVDDRFGNFTVALGLNGSDQYIEVDNLDQPLMTGNEVTFEGWFNTFDLTGGAFLLSSPGIIAFIDDAGILGFAPQTTEASYITESTVSVGLNEWFHFAGTYDGSTTKIYVNGVETASNQIDQVINIGGTGTTRIGGNGGSNFAGLLDDVTVYNYALNVEEIEELYAENNFASPIVSQVFPTSGAPGTSIRIYGKNLSQAGTAVLVSGNEVTPTIVNDNLLYFTVPDIGSGAQIISVSNNFDTSLSQGFTILNTNEASVSFGISSLITTGVSTPVELHATDLNGDGYPDFLAASFNEGNITTYLNNTDGTFGLPTTIFTSSNTGSTGLSTIRSGDLDQDGDIDIVTTYQNNLYWFENDGTGTFISSSLFSQLSTTDDNYSDIQLGDLNGDGVLDIVVTTNAGTIDWFSNDGTGSFISEGVISSSPVAFKLSLNDFDNDGDLDIAQAYTTNFILLNDGFGTFNRTDLTSPAVSGYNGLITADFNNDDLIDMVAGSQNNQNIDVYLNGNNVPTNIHQSGDGSSPYDFAVGDVDGDGDTDLITAFFGGNLTIYFNDGNAGFTAEVIDSNLTTLSRTSIADIDNDGDLDIFTSRESGEITWYENQVPSDRKEFLSYDVSAGATPSIDDFTSIGVFEGSRYYVSIATQTWTDAKIIAESLGGHLATIHSQEENDFIDAAVDAVWVGGTDQEVEGQFRWVDGTPFDFINWLGDEPNGSTGENFVQLNGDGTWNDLSNELLPFVIEIPFYEGIVNPTNNSISVEVPFGIDVSSLVAYFDLSVGAFAESNEVLQESGVTVNDFTLGLDYLVTAEDASIKNWTVSISVDDGILAFYPFNDNASDESGNGNSLTSTDAVLSSNRFENENAAYSFNGTTSQLQNSDADLLVGEYEVSLVFWAKPVLDGDFQDVVNFGNVRAFINESGRMKFQLSTLGSSVQYDAEIEEGEWQQYVLTFDKDTARVYRDAVLADKNEKYGAIDAGGILTVGSSGSGNYYEGSIDDILVYNRALSESEILSLYNENGWPPLATETDILTFDVSGQIDQELISSIDHTVDIIVDYNTDISALTPSFTLSEGAIAIVNSQLQTSGTSTNNFTNPVTYSITAEDNIATQDWLVTIALDSVQGDSLALVALYNATGGDNWTTSWNLNDPMSTWGGLIFNSEGRVTSMILDGNNLTSELPSDLGNLTKIRLIQMADNNLSGSIPATLGSLGDLQSLHLYGNGLSGSIPSALGNLSSVFFQLLLSNNQLTGSIPAALGNLSSLSDLDLSSNELSGSIPTQLGNLSNLVILNLSNNNLSGSIPPSLANINNSNLQGLYLGYNSLTGSIPNEFANLTNPYQLTLEYNELSGNIPDIFSGFTNLNYFNVAGNNLTGSIPTSLAGVTSLQFFDASFNQLSGDIPTEFSNLTGLSFFRVQFNALESLPDMTGSSLNEGLSVNDNKIGFADIQANLSISSFDFNPQTVDDTVRQLVSPDSPVLMSTSENASGTNYQWQKDDVVMDGQTNSTLEVTEPGRYTVLMTNDNVTGLTITRAPYILTGSDATDILSFSFDGFESDVVYGNGTIDIEVPFGSPSLSSLVAIYELSPGATAEIGGTPQESGVTSNDFSGNVTYTVTALDAITTQDWVITTTIGPNPANDIENFDIANMVGDEAINFDNHTVSITMPYNTDRAVLTPFIAVSTGATIDPLSNTPQDFTSTFSYTVTSESGIAQDWTIDVTNELNNETNITSFVIPNQVVEESIDFDNHTILVRMPFGTDVTALIPTISLSPGATITPTSGTPRDFTNPVVYNVIPEDNSASQSWTITVEVDASPNNNPTSLTIDNASIDENTIGLVGTFSSVDPDGDTQVYSLINGIGGTNNTSFTISGNQLSSTVAFDFENKASYSILVRVDDQRGGKLDQQFTINVTDVNEAPSIADQTFTLDENTTSGFVGDVEAEDVDANSSLNFSITNGVTAFDISGTGSIIVNDGSQLDFESAPTFTLTVNVTDGELSSEATITINLNDVNEAPIVEVQTFAIVENSTNGTDLASPVVASDPENSILFYSITGGAGSSVFAINESTGLIQVVDGSQLDFESVDSFDLMISVSDGTQATSANMTINLTDVNEAPIVEDQTFAIVENSANGTSVGTVVAVDQDNNISSFAITAGNTSDAFAIDNSGTITVNDVTILDFEITPQFVLTITVTDAGTAPLSDEADITINLIDVVENVAPTDIAVTPANNSENTAIGSVIGTLSSTDPDDNNTHTYSLISGDISNFEIVGSELRNTAVFDFEVKSNYVMTVRSTDQDDAFYDKELTIDIVNVNEATTFSLTGNPTSNAKEDFNVSATILDQDGIASVKLYTKKVSGASFTASGSLAATDDVYTHTINGATAMDNIGVEYYFEMQDEFGTEVSETFIVSTVVDAGSVSISDKVNPGTSVSNYSILAFPFESVNVSTLFSGLGTYRNDWRLIKYENGTYIDINSGTVSPGVGYWFITKSDGTVNTGGKSVNVEDGVYRINLNPSGGVGGGDGYTMIGNPFQGTLNWSTVIQHNIDEGIISSGQVQSSLIGYNGQFTSKSSLNALEGAFIQSSIPVTGFEIPVSAVSNGGRVENVKNQPIQTFIDENEWQLDLFFKTASYQYSIGGIGVAQDAKDDRDSYDFSILPRLEVYLDLLFEDGSTRSIKQSDNFKSWTFNVRNNLPEEVIDMTWNIPVSSNKTIILVDAASQKIYDLQHVKAIQLKNNPSATHQLYYGDRETIYQNLKLPFDAYVTSYPNPVEHELTLKMYASNGRSSKLELVSLDGKSYSIGQIQLVAGLNTELINLDSYSIPAGIYFLKMDGKMTTKILKQ